MLFWHPKKVRANTVNHRKLLLKLLGVVYLSMISSASYADVLQIATASNFRAPFETLIENYESTSLRPVYASSGKLIAQIRHGAPIDIFLSAEPIGKHLPEELIVDGSEFTYAYGQLALVGELSQNKNTEQLLEFPQTLPCLAIANPSLAPYGRAAEQVIKHLEGKGWKFERIVKGQSVAQAFQFFDSGACDHALVAYAQVLANTKKIEHTLIRSTWHEPIQQNAILLKRAENKPEALRFFEFLKSKEARKIIRDSGYLMFSGH